MRVRTEFVSIVIGMIGLVPFLALAQCGMTGMGHAGHESAAPKPKAPSKEIQVLLTDRKSRTELIQAVIADREFMHALVDSIVWIPEWNALMRDRLAEGRVPRAPEEEGPADVSEPGHHH